MNNPPADQGSTESHNAAGVDEVVLVGHCGFDSGSLSRFAGKVLPEASVSRINTQSELDKVATAKAVWLVNRKLGGRFDSDEGVELIRKFAQADDPPKLILISDYPDAQSDAEAAGALPGFGKREIGTPEATQRLQDAAGA